MCHCKQHIASLLHSMQLVLCVFACVVLMAMLPYLRTLICLCVCFACVCFACVCFPTPGPGAQTTTSPIVRK